MRRIVLKTGDGKGEDEDTKLFVGVVLFSLIVSFLSRELQSTNLNVQPNHHIFDVHI